MRFTTVYFVEGDGFRGYVEEYFGFSEWGRTVEECRDKILSSIAAKIVAFRQANRERMKAQRIHLLEDLSEEIYDLARKLGEERDEDGAEDHDAEDRRHMARVPRRPPGH